MRQYRAYTDNDIILAASQAKSMAELLGKLNLVKAGGNYANMKRLVQKLKIDCSHWICDNASGVRGKMLKDWSQYTKSAQLKKHLIKERGQKCEDCQLTNWKNQLIKLELHHIDGDRTNNEKSNLQLLCPNCHAYTPNFRNCKKIN